MDEHLLLPPPLVALLFRFGRRGRRIRFRLATGTRRPVPVRRGFQLLALPRLPGQQAVRRAVQPQLSGFERFVDGQAGHVEAQQDGIAHLVVVITIRF